MAVEISVEQLEGIDDVAEMKGLIVRLLQERDDLKVQRDDLKEGRDDLKQQNEAHKTGHEKLRQLIQRGQEDYLTLRDEADRHIVNHREATDLATRYLHCLTRISSVVESYEKLMEGQFKAKALLAALRSELGERFQTRLRRVTRSHEEMLAHAEKHGSEEPEADDAG